MNAIGRLSSDSTKKSVSLPGKSSDQSEVSNFIRFG